MSNTTYVYILRKDDHFVELSPSSRPDSAVRFLTGELSKWLSDHKITYSLDYVGFGRIMRDEIRKEYVIQLPISREAMFFKLTWM